MIGVKVHLLVSTARALSHVNRDTHASETYADPLEGLASIAHHLVQRKSRAMASNQQGRPIGKSVQHHRIDIKLTKQALSYHKQMWIFLPAHT